MIREVTPNISPGGDLNARIKLEKIDIIGSSSDES
jgi:hypothetical protein